MAAWWWSWLLMAVGVAGLYVAGQRSRWGWAIGLGAQALWVAYALASKQYGFLASALAYGAVYARNLWRWTQEHRAEHGPSRTFLRAGKAAMLRVSFRPRDRGPLDRHEQELMDIMMRGPQVGWKPVEMRGVDESTPGASDARPRSVQSDGNVPCAGLGDPRCDATCRIKPRCGVLGMTYTEESR